MYIQYWQLDKHKKFIHQIFASSHSSFNVFLLKGKSKTFMGCLTARPASGNRQEEKHATLNPNLASLLQQQRHSNSSQIHC
jgi:hypothetical protein